MRKSGINIIGDIPWGTHFCQFYQTKDDLIDILIPYFKAGLENNEFCICITSEPFTKKDVEKSLSIAIPNFDEYLLRKQIEIIPYDEWYIKDGHFDSQRVLNDWINKLNQSLSNGYEGLRAGCNLGWLDRKYWQDFVNYEEIANNIIVKYKMIVVCSYLLDNCSASEVLDVINNHQFAIAIKNGKWTVIESFKHKYISEIASVNKLLQSEIENHKRTEDALRYRLIVEGIIANISNRFIGATFEQIDNEINSSLRMIGEFTDVDGSYIYLFSGDGSKVERVYEWLSKKDMQSAKDLAEISLETFKWATELIKRTGIFYVPSVDELPPEANAEKEICQSISVKSILAVPLFSENLLKGFLVLGSKEKKKNWTKEDINLIKLVGTIFVGALIRKEFEEQMKKSLKDKEVLLREIHHRVKNNLQIIYSLLSLQSKGIKDENLLTALKDTQSRIKSMSLVHDKLYQSKNLDKIDFASYVKSLLNELFYSYSIQSKNVKLNININDIFINIDTAIPCGLIINELVSNSLKYAFQLSGKGEINVELKLLQDYEEATFVLIVSDNGIGLPEDLDFRNAKSLGLQLVNDLTSQLKGTIELIKDSGTKFKITFKERKRKERI